jgi:hypothetical protein
MDSHEKKLRTRLARSLGDMAEGIIKREPPFDEIPFQDEATDKLFKKYLEYFDELETPFRQSILSMFIDSARESFKMGARVDEIGSFNSRHPQHVETGDQFVSWIKNREGHIETVNLSLGPTPPIKVTAVIKRVMQERLQEFKFEKGVMPGAIAFSKPILTDNKVYVLVDKGTQRQFIDFMIGLKWPESYFDIAEFFCRGQSWYGYNSEEELIAGVSKAMDLVEALLPHFVDRAEKALGDD